MVNLVERTITKDELGIMKQGFDRLDILNGGGPHVQTRHEIAAEDSSKFIGCISGLQSNIWFFITDLWLENNYRGQKIGSDLLQQLESRLRKAGVKNIYTNTATHNAPDFYEKHGYKVFFEMKNYFSNGGSQIYFWKEL